MNLQQIGEFANDYIEVRREYTDWTTFSNSMNGQAPEMLMTDIYIHGDQQGKADLQQEVHHEELSLEPIPEKPVEEVAFEGT